MVSLIAFALLYDVIFKRLRAFTFPQSNKFLTSQDFFVIKKIFHMQRFFPSLGNFFTRKFFFFIKEVFHKLIFFPQQGSFSKAKLFLLSIKAKLYLMIIKVFSKQSLFIKEMIFYLYATENSFLNHLVIRKSYAYLTKQMSF